MAAHLIILRLTGWDILPEGPAEGQMFGRFLKLEALEVWLSTNLPDLLRSFTQLPALRILSFVSRSLIGGNDVDALLASPSFNARLEFLRLQPLAIGRATFDRIANECTSLLGLELQLDVGHCTVAEPVDEAE